MARRRPRRPGRRSSSLPYVDVTLYPTYNLVAAAQTQGIKYFSLAFITADSKNQPAWGGYDEYEVNGGAFDMALRQQVASIRALGGDVMASFGGEAGQELAQVITNVSQLTAAYQTVVTDYNLTHLDFDIEGAAVADHASIDRRSQALAALAANGRRGRPSARDLVHAAGAAQRIDGRRAVRVAIGVALWREDRRRQRDGDGLWRFGGAEPARPDGHVRHSGRDQPVQPTARRSTARRSPMRRFGKWWA